MKYEIGITTNGNEFQYQIDFEYWDNRTVWERKAFAGNELAPLVRNIAERIIAFENTGEQKHLNEG